MIRIGLLSLSVGFIGLAGFIYPLTPARGDIIDGEFDVEHLVFYIQPGHVDETSGSTGATALADILKVERAPIPAAHGMFVKSESEIWLADTFRNLDAQSKVYDSKSKLPKFANLGGGIAGISKRPGAEVYSFCDIVLSQVTWLDANGKQILQFSIPNPWNARWTPSGEAMFVVTYGGSVLRVSKGSQVEEIVTSLDAPFDIAPIGEEEFWLSAQGAAGVGKVCRYKKSLNSDKYEKVLCNHGIDLDNPEGLWPLSDGSVVVVDTGRGTLLKIEKDGSVKILEERLGIPILVQLLGGGRWVVYTNQSAGGPALIFGHSKELE